MSEVIKTVGLCKGNILSDIGFSMEKGELVAVMGPSGSGKSTFLYLLSGMDTPDAGEVLFDDENISACSEERRADIRLNRMGFVFQQMNMLPDLNIIDNIVLPASQSRRGRGGAKRQEGALQDEATALMKKLGLAGLEKRRITEVSGGQLQRACICRAMMNRPGLLLADEPTGALNRAASEEIMEEFVRLNREGMSVLIVTHDSKVAACCDRILYLTDGKISGECILGKCKHSEKQERERALGSWLEQQGW